MTVPLLADTVERRDRPTMRDVAALAGVGICGGKTGHGSPRIEIAKA